jgi:hypothetical protein
MFLYSKAVVPNISSQLIESSIMSISLASIPEANAPPMRPPMLVPADKSIGIRCSSNQRMTPTWASPLALPPPNATPIAGREPRT